MDELLDDELYQVDPVLADLEALVKYVFFQIVFGAVVTCSQILEKNLRMDGKYRFWGELRSPAMWCIT